MQCIFYIILANILFSIMLSIFKPLVIDVDMTNWGKSITTSRRPPVGLTIAPIIFVDLKRAHNLKQTYGFTTDEEAITYLLNHEYIHYKQFMWATPIEFATIYGLNTLYLFLTNRITETYYGANIFEAQAVWASLNKKKVDFKYKFISLRTINNRNTK